MYVPRSGATWSNPYPMYRALQTRDPVHFVEDGRYWVLTRFDDVYAAARDHRRFSSAQGLTFTYGEREKIGLDAIAPMVMLDPPEHTAFRRIVARAMTPRKVAEIESLIRSFVNERLDAWENGEVVDLVATLALPVANFVVAHFLGVPEVDREKFGDWTEAIVEANALGDVALAGARLSELVGYFAALIDERRTHPGSDLISMLVQTEPEVPAAQVLGFAFTMVAGGNDTAAGLIAGGTEILSTQPTPGAISTDVVDELARLVSPVQGLARTTTEDVSLHGRVIPTGHKVLLCYGAANRDPHEFGDGADAFESNRSIRRMLAFGSGAHHCLGAAAARLEVRITLEELVTCFPKLVVDEVHGTFAQGNYVRRRAKLPVDPGPRA